MPPVLPPAVRDPARLQSVRATGLLDSLPEEAFDRLTRLAARVIGVPVALLTLVDGDRQFFKSAVGLAEPWASARQTPLSHSFCQHVVGAAEPFVVEDARSHPLVAANEAVDALGVASYAGVPLTTPEGHVLGSFCAIDHAARAWAPEDLEALRDLAAMAMTEVALRRTNRDHRLLTENASDMISTHSPEGVYRYASQAAQTLLGYPPEALVGRMAYELFHPDDVPAIEASHAAALADGSRAVTTRYRIRRADASYLWVETRGQLTPDGPQGPEIVAVTRDISDQKAIEAVLSDEREQFQMLTEAIPQLVWTASPDGSLDYVSGQVAAYAGRSRSDIVGTGWVDMLHPDDVPPTLERWTHALATGEPYEVEFRLRDTAGVYRWHLGRALPLRNAAGAVSRWFGTNTDISDRKGLEAALEAEKAQLEALLASLHEAQAQLVQQEKMAGIGRVTAGIAHEIQNPLNFVINFSELAAGLAEELRGAVPPGDASQTLDDLADNVHRVVHHGQRAGRIARSMLALARTAPPSRRRADLNALVAKHLALAREERPQPAVTVETAFDPAAGALSLDTQAVGSAVRHLVTNALDALGDRARAEGAAFAPVLRVATRRTADAVELEIADNGAGIADDVAPHVFEPFYTTKAPGQGVGLGLALCHETVVQGQGGTLDIRTDPGQGTTVTATFPLAAPDGDGR